MKVIGRNGKEVDCPRYLGSLVVALGLAEEVKSKNQFVPPTPCTGDAHWTVFDGSIWIQKTEGTTTSEKERTPPTTVPRIEVWCDCQQNQGAMQFQGKHRVLAAKFFHVGGKVERPPKEIMKEYASALLRWQRQ